MSNTCNFVWYELMTTDTVAAEAFYCAVVGWGTIDAGGQHEGYKMFTVGQAAIGGMMTLPQEVCEMGGKPSWTGYIAVQDTDADAAKIEALGGKIYRAPDDIPEVGRFAVVADPHGAVFNIMTPLGEAPAGGPDPKAPGMPGWSELHAGNGPEAFAFYSEIFGWQKTDAMDMGDLGVYQLFGTGGDSIGGMMTKMADTPAPMWVYYFNVEDINAASARVKENGGQILMGPHEVPGGNWIVQCIDPQGALFALLTQAS